jgi:hypothetical protein
MEALNCHDAAIKIDWVIMMGVGVGSQVLFFFMRGYYDF